MKSEYIKKIAESKVKYHKKRAKMSYEEKFNVIIELQKIDIEMSRRNKQRGESTKNRRVWIIQE
jgi:hypothetical protein